MFCVQSTLRVGAMESTLCDVEKSTRTRSVTMPLATSLHISCLMFFSLDNRVGQAMARGPFVDSYSGLLQEEEDGEEELN